MKPHNLLFIEGELMNKAKEKVKVDYNFVKWTSRNKSDESPEISLRVKRAELNAEEKIASNQVDARKYGIIE